MKLKGSERPYPEKSGSHDIVETPTEAHPLVENAAGFLDWFLEMPCYQLIYSDNEKMLNAMDKILSDDL